MTKITYPNRTEKEQIGFNRVIKRLFDIIVSTFLLVLLTPMLLLFSLLILIFSGRPIFFKQIRTGKDNKPFVIWKFRTMEINMNKKNPHQYSWIGGVPNSFIFKTPATQKITRIGKVYRKLSLDELPQLINVLKGEMSLIGPRPEIPEITKFYNQRQATRLNVKPGITGYAQINGRSIINHGTKIEYDLYYVERQSLGLDMKIIFKSISQVVRGKGAC